MNEKQDRTFIDRETGRRGHLVHRIKAKDRGGRWAYYFVMVPHDREETFLHRISQQTEHVDLGEFGVVIASNYGEAPNEATLEFLRNQFGFDFL